MTFSHFFLKERFLKTFPTGESVIEPYRGVNTCRYLQGTHLWSVQSVEELTRPARPVVRRPYESRVLAEVMRSRDGRSSDVLRLSSIGHATVFDDLHVYFWKGQEVLVHDPFTISSAFFRMPCCPLKGFIGW